MAGQPDSSDDLIAELAKLMAQDAQQPERPAPAPRAPATPAPQSSPQAPFSLRIPGTSPEPQVEPRAEPVAEPRVEPRVEPQAPSVSATVPRFDFNRPPAAAPAAPARQEPAFAPAMTDAAPTPPATPEPSANPFNFDFDLGQRRSPDAPSSPIPAATPAPSDDETDAIADLIAAEMADEPEEAPAAPSASRYPAPPPVSSNADDSFGIPPVFGLGSRPAPVNSAPATFGGRYNAAPIADDSHVAPVASGSAPDPIDEIESLIGRAVRVELDNKRPEAPIASPALRSLATPTLPTPEKSAPQRAMSGADEAILAAAAATGADVGWVDPAPARQAQVPPEPRHDRAPRAAGFSRALAGPLVAVGLLLAAGFGLYWVLGLGGEPGPAPLLTAEATPTKDIPEAPPAADQVQQSVVFNEMDGVVPGGEETLVSRDQADLNEVTQVPPPSVTEEGLANIKVRTVTVRPDGTIVSGDDSVAGAAILPVDRPNVPTVPGADLAATSTLPDVPADPEPVAAVTPATPAIPPAVPGTTVPVVDATGAPVAGKMAPVPMTRPASFRTAAATTPTPVTAVVDPAPVAVAAPIAEPQDVIGMLAAEPAAPAASAPAAPAVAAAPSQPVAATPGNTAPAYVQLSSQRSEEAARQTAAELTTRFGPLFGGSSLEVQQVDLGARGVFFRVRVPAASTQGANEICTGVKAAGGDCFIL